jgi:hypothetical protein
MDLRYPIGSFSFPKSTTAEQRQSWIAEVAVLPDTLRVAVSGLTPEQLETPYRPGGWTVRQVVHHIPDSHLNSYVRFKLALTEEEPTIKPYNEARWAELTDSQITPTAVSITLLEALHDRWVRLMRSFSETDFTRTFRHPRSALYGWIKSSRCTPGMVNITLLT